jgi:hypothetical protein
MKKKILWVCLAAAGFITEINAQNSIAKWQAEPVLIDGNSAEWGVNPRFFNAESNILYEYRNDGQHLYLILKSNDQATQMQLRMAGFSLKFKLKTDPIQKFSLTFPAHKGGMPPMERTGNMNSGNLRDRSLENPAFQLKDTVIVEGFKYNNGIISSDNMNMNGICFSKGKGNKDQAAVEIQIPLEEIYGKDFRLESCAETPIQLQISINEMSRNTMVQRGRQMGGHGMSGGGMRGGEGMRGGMHGGMMPEQEMSERPEMAEGSRMANGFSMERKSFNVTFKLAGTK